MTNEAHFHLDGFVNPKVIHQRPLHAAKVPVWCGITASKSVWPYFFEDTNGNAVSINGDQYKQMIREYLFPEMRNMNVDNIFFQQDRATAHTAKKIIRNVKGNFSTQITFSFWGRTVTALIFRSKSSWFLSLGMLEIRVYTGIPDTIQELEWNITQEINSMTQEILSKVMNSTVKRPHCCLTNNGSQLKDIVFHT